MRLLSQPKHLILPIGPVKTVKTVPNIGTLVDKKLINPSAFAIPANSGANTLLHCLVLINAPNPKTTGPVQQQYHRK